MKCGCDGEFHQRGDVPPEYFILRPYLFGDTDTRGVLTTPRGFVHSKTLANSIQQRSLDKGKEKEKEKKTK